jgi:methylated-DNA-[protein]-cysteine S-methyltransferase
VSDLPDLTHALEASGLVDVAYTLEDSPVGRLLLAATPRGLVRVAYLEGTEGRRADFPAADRVPGEVGEDDVLTDLSRRLSPRILRNGARLDAPRRELEAFFNGSLERFQTPIDWRLTRPGFTRAVLRATSRIPFGQTTSYGGVASAAGSPKAFRAAGSALGSNPLPIVIPCHRVLHAGGGLGGYTGGLDRKRVLLTVEGHQLR